MSPPIIDSGEGVNSSAPTPNGSAPSPVAALSVGALLELVARYGLPVVMTVILTMYMLWQSTVSQQSASSCAATLTSTTQLLARDSAEQTALLRDIRDRILLALPRSP